MDNNNTTFTAKDFKKGQPRWCPGCGDHFFLASLHKAMAELGIAPWQTAVISGIGCSSRLPYYMNTYAMQTIHGRAAAISTGAKVANILLNNRIYGLTKGQYSPTSPRGFVSKSSPYGTVEDPFHPAELCFGARGRFFARAVATDAQGGYPEGRRPAQGRLGVRNPPELRHLQQRHARLRI